MTYNVVHTMFANHRVHFLVTVNLVRNCTKQARPIFTHAFNYITSLPHLFLKPSFLLKVKNQMTGYSKNAFLGKRPVPILLQKQERLRMKIWQVHIHLRCCIHFLIHLHGRKMKLLVQYGWVQGNFLRLMKKQHCVWQN